MSRHFPNFIDAYVSYTRNQEASEKIHKWVAISIIAAALERKVWINRGYYLLFPNLYTFIIGASGIVRKSTSTGIGVDLLRNLERFNIMSERVTAGSLIQQLERSGMKYVAGGREMRQSATFCYASELKVFLDEVFGSISELLTTFYDCQPNDCTKPWVYETKSAGQTKIYGPCLNMLGASTPTWLVRAIPASEMEGGFSSRVIFVVENSPPTKFVAWPELEKGADQTRMKLIDDLREIHELCGEFRIDKLAKAHFEEWYKEHQLSLVSAGNDTRFSGYFGRKGDTILKLAMILAVSRSNDLVIQLEHIEWAIMMLDELEVSMFEAFGATGKNENSAELVKIWEMLRKNPWNRHDEVMRQVWRDMDSKGLMSIAEDLQRMNLIRPKIINGQMIYETLQPDVTL